MNNAAKRIQVHDATHHYRWEVALHELEEDYATREEELPYEKRQRCVDDYVRTYKKNAEDVIECATCIKRAALANLEGRAIYIDHDTVLRQMQDYAVRNNIEKLHRYITRRRREKTTTGDGA